MTLANGCTVKAQIWDTGKNPPPLISVCSWAGALPGDLQRALPASPGSDPGLRRDQRADLRVDPDLAGQSQAERGGRPHYHARRQ